MKKYYADFHVHIGRSSCGHGIKMATASNLTFGNIAYESLYRKGINIIGVVDCISPYVLEDIEKLVDTGRLKPLKGGCMEYESGQAILTGAEIETHETRGCSAHSLCFFPTLGQVRSFSHEMAMHMANILTCSSISHLTAQELFNIVDGHGGILIPAHVFTPHKSFYGTCCRSLLEIFDPVSYDRIPAVELGLSSDTAMASRLSELDGKAFLSDSDAHSLARMGREYNVLELENPDFSEILKALHGKEGRRISANYGLNPMLGKYHRTYCLKCDKVLKGDPPVYKCPVSEKHQVVVGVRDRLEYLADREQSSTKLRPPYHYQVPLSFIPKVGPKTINRLIERFGSEMFVLHEASLEALADEVGVNMACSIILAREGRLGLQAGGGGVYGRVGKE
jgi:uncharacterized protein (TIGR00375 family)